MTVDEERHIGSEKDRNREEAGLLESLDVQTS